MEDSIDEFRKRFKNHDTKTIQVAVRCEIIAYANKYFKKIVDADKRKEAFFDQVEKDTDVPRPQKSTTKRRSGDISREKKIRTNEYYLRPWLVGKADQSYVLLVYYWLHVFAHSSEYAIRIDKTLLRSQKHTRRTNYEIFFGEEIPGKSEIEAIRNQGKAKSGSNSQLAVQPEPETEQKPKKPKAKCPSKWPQTGEQVELRLSDFQRRPFFGRVSATQELDAFINNCNNGLLVISAPAGSGKSALLANWLDALQASNENVGYHFISMQYPLTTAEDAILGNLVEQIRMLQSKDNTGFIASGADNLGQQLYNELMNYPRSEKRLILILDGLDEAANVFEPFVERTGLPENIFVIVSARKDGKALPVCLRSWHERLDQGLPGRSLNLEGLEKSDINTWLEGVVGNLDAIQSRELVTALLKTTDGLPLFLSFVINDLKNSFTVMTNRKAMLQLVTSMPAPFSKYIAQQLGILAEVGNNIPTKRVLRLFAILSRTLA